jgi:hypothetical protein
VPISPKITDFLDEQMPTILHVLVHNHLGSGYISVKSWVALFY